jgi:hypothetical protein
MKTSCKAMHSKGNRTYNRDNISTMRHTIKNKHAILNLEKAKHKKISRIIGRAWKKNSIFAVIVSDVSSEFSIS